MPCKTLKLIFSTFIHEIKHLFEKNICWFEFLKNLLKMPWIDFNNFNLHFSQKYTWDRLLTPLWWIHKKLKSPFGSIELNRTNFEQIHFLKNWLHPMVGVESNKSNSNQFSSNFSKNFCLVESIESQIFESNRTIFERIPIWLHP